MKLGQLYSEMIYVKGLIHCDPHPGNILIKKKDDGSGQEVILLDHGLYLVSYYYKLHSFLIRELFSILFILSSS